VDSVVAWVVILIVDAAICQVAVALVAIMACWTADLPIVDVADSVVDAVVRYASDVVWVLETTRTVARFLILKVMPDRRGLPVLRSPTHTIRLADRVTFCSQIRRQSVDSRRTDHQTYSPRSIAGFFRAPQFPPIKLRLYFGLCK
jgi:hypothetical protein